MHQKNQIVCIGALFAAVAVGMGAWGAHGLEEWLHENFPEDIAKRLANWKTAVLYHMFHSLGLILIGIVHRQQGGGRLLIASAGAMVLGIILFSGMLYAWVLLNQRWMVMLVPLGGLAFIVAWVGFAFGSCRCKTDCKSVQP